MNSTNYQLDHEAVIEKVNVLSETISKYGAGIVAIAMIYVLFIIVVAFFAMHFAKIVRQNEKRTDDFIKYLKESSSPKNSSDVVKSSIESVNIIVDHLKYVCSVAKCDRAAVYMFHNGQYLLNGSHLMKFSCLVEFSLLTKHKYVSVQKDLPISQIQDLCAKILNGEDLVFENISREDSGPFEEWHNQHGTKSVVVHPVYNKDGYILGFVSAEYYTENIVAHDINAAKEAVHSLADKVSITMDLNKQFTK